MAKHGDSILVSEDLDTAYDLILHYFGSIGYVLTNSVKPTHATFEYGNKWQDEGKWDTKYRILDIDLTRTGPQTMIRFSYDINWMTYEGKKDTNAANIEVQNLLNYIDNYNSSNGIGEQDRICVNCKKKIPWDANLCPYCKYIYKKLESNKSPKESELEHKPILPPPPEPMDETISKSSENVIEKKKGKFCPYCGKMNEAEYNFCVKCKKLLPEVK